MNQAGVDPATLDAVVVTHEHEDHVGGIAVTARKLGIPVYFTQLTHQAWQKSQNPSPRMSRTQWMEAIKLRPAEPTPAQVAKPDIPAEKRKDYLPNLQYFSAGQAFVIGDIQVTPFTVPHDAVDPVGFVFNSEGVRIAIATDLGYVPANIKSHLRNIDVLLLESNHDIEMLRDGPYPWSVKQRVLSRTGHLSNEAAAQFLLEEYDGKARYIVLGHLSESNNDPDLARLTIEGALSSYRTFNPKQLLVASQYEPLPSICL
jgi:phosphoribosyl 1,2-cyclic phosphodiesterase